MTPRPIVAGTLTLTLALLGTASCEDPVHDAEITALGPEAPGVPPGPNHRPGQPCLTCHGGQGPASATFVTAGTIYETPYSPGTPSYPPLVGGNVTLVDSTGSAYNATTNTVGNFWVTPTEWNAVFPLGDLRPDAGPEAGVEGISVGTSPLGGQVSMQTAIHRGGVYASCAYCHFDHPGPTSPGHVYQH